MKESMKQGKRSVLRKPLFFWVRLLLGGIFVAASVDKIMNPAAFAALVHNYRILPDALINLTAVILPWLELLLGVFLLAGLFLPGTVFLTNVLLVTFFSILVFNVARGLDVHCGCFSTRMEGDPATTWYLIRDGFFLVLGAYLFYGAILSRGRIVPSTRRL